MSGADSGAQALLSPEPRLLGSDGQKPLILVVDDDPTNLKLLTRTVAQEGAEVRQASSGLEALAQARLAPVPDLVLLDVMMPAMDGHAVLAELRREAQTRDIPVIFVTALSDQQEEERGLKEGAVDYITKPIKRSVLITRVRAQLELQRSRKLLAAQKDWLELEVGRRARENSQLEARLRLAFESVGFGIWEYEHEHDNLRWNESLCALLGYAEGPAHQDDLLALLHPEDRPLHTLGAAPIAPPRTNGADASPVAIAEIRLRHAEGHWVWLESRARTVQHDEQGHPRLTVGTMVDIGPRKTAEAERLLTSVVFTGISDGVCITDAARHILMINPAFAQVTGYTSEEVVGQNPRFLKSGVHPPSFYTDMWDKLNRYGNWQGEITNRRKDGSLVSEWLNISAVQNGAGAVTHYVGLFSDLSERKAAAERIQYLASFDTLTNLPNRHLFTDRLDQALLTARRFVRGTALILLDIDRFRFVNDTLGPTAGDQILVEVARRLSLQVREGDTVGRRGGNEFGFVMANLGHERDAITLAHRVLEAIAVPFEVAGQTVNITASLGIAVSPKNGDDSQTLGKSAEAALLRAKQAGRNTFRFHSPEMDGDAARRLALEKELRHALERKELSVEYQPQISLDSGHMIGVEALLRWRSPTFGTVSPSEFIPIAEESGLLVSIGEWVLRTACHQTKAWLDLGLLPLRLSVNLSTRQFLQANLLSVVADALAVSGLPASALELEITENSFIGDLEEAVALCRRLKGLGVKLSLDDFGTGYSSLACITRFPFDKLKIDQTFVQDIIENPVNAAIATAAIVMARSLNLAVLAEGVETEAQASFLRGRRCDAMQGYLFSPPLPPEQFAPLLRQQKKLAIADQPRASVQTLLLVDDEPHVLSSLTRLLRREGYSILAATSAQEGFELLAKNPETQVIISDQRMPEMSGTEFLERARQLYPDTVRMVLTGYTDLESVTSAINRGAIYKFLTKPWDDDQLREQIREAFRLYKKTPPPPLGIPIPGAP